MTNAALFLFLAAVVVSLFAFLSMALWVSAQARERRSRDRFALLKSLAEHPGENAQQILNMLREEEDARVARSIQEKRRGFLVGGLIVASAGLGLSVLLAAIVHENIWTVGLIPLLIGCVLFFTGLSTNRGSAGPNRKLSS